MKGIILIFVIIMTVSSKKQRHFHGSTFYWFVFQVNSLSVSTITPLKCYSCDNWSDRCDDVDEMDVKVRIKLRNLKNYLKWLKLFRIAIIQRVIRSKLKQFAWKSSRKMVNIHKFNPINKNKINNSFS